MTEELVWETLYNTIDKLKATYEELGKCGWRYLKAIEQWNEAMVNLDLEIRRLWWIRLDF